MSKTLSIETDLATLKQDIAEQRRQLEAERGLIWDGASGARGEAQPASLARLDQIGSRLERCEAQLHALDQRLSDATQPSASLEPRRRPLARILIVAVIVLAPVMSWRLYRRSLRSTAGASRAPQHAPAASPGEAPARLAPPVPDALRPSEEGWRVLEMPVPWELTPALAPRISRAAAMPQRTSDPDASTHPNRPAPAGSASDRAVAR